MKDLDDHKKIAVLIDADNAQLSCISSILEELSAHGHIVVKRAYGDWSNVHLKNWKLILNELAIQPIQQFAYTTGKNATDASMIIDAMDLLYSKRFGAFALVSSDSDFTKLASRLKESEIFVFGFGQQKTPIAFRNACDNFIFTENLIHDDKKESIAQYGQSKLDDDYNRLMHLFRRAWEQYQDDTGWTNLRFAGRLAKRSNPDFDPRNYGVSNLSNLLKQLNKDFEIKMLSVKNSSRRMIVMYRPTDEALNNSVEYEDDQLLKMN